MITEICGKLNSIKDDAFIEKGMKYSQCELLSFFNSKEIVITSDLMDFYTSIAFCDDYDYFDGLARFIPILSEDQVIEYNVYVSNMDKPIILIPIFDMISECRIFYASIDGDGHSKIFIDALVDEVWGWCEKYSSLESFLEDIFMNKMDIFC